MKFLSALKDAAIYPHPVGTIELIETHISWVYLTGDFAYKIKKPINLGFLDFSTLDKRRYYCYEEIRLNKRLAPQLYIDVVSITIDDGKLSINGIGSICEYAVRMKQFPQQQQFDRLLKNGQLYSHEITDLANIIAEFHQNTLKIMTTSNYGDTGHINRPILENFSHIRELVSEQSDLITLQNIEKWSLAQFDSLKPLLEQRKQQGFVRECHGDMHLRNIAYFNAKIIIFDGIEFSENLRCIDVMSEVAFIEMDLIDRGRTDFAYILLNRYLESTGDYPGLQILRFYMVYRAMVRAKVDCIRAHQDHIEAHERQQILGEFRHYLNLAQDFTAPLSPFLLITHGLSGSGKTFITSELIKYLPIIRIRSDVERKRLFGISADQSSESEVNSGIYTKDASEKTYRTLLDLATNLIRSGWSVIVDAAFLKEEQRAVFQQLAEQSNIPFLILKFESTTDQLKQRITQRQHRHSDASEANISVLEKKLTSVEHLTEQENLHAISINSSERLIHQTLVENIQAHINSNEATENPD